MYGANRSEDVKTVQKLLNKCPQQWGGPSPALGVDGVIGPKTKAAIGKFQERQLKSNFDPDQRVDPSGGTLERLNLIAPTEQRSGAEKSIEISGMRLVIQKGEFHCWAAMHAMLLGFRDGRLYSPREAALDVDGRIGGTKYTDQFDALQGIKISDWKQFAVDAGHEVFMNRCYTVSFWFDLLSQRRPLGIVIQSGIYRHTQVVCGIRGDGSTFGSSIWIYDPRGKIFWKNYHSYLEDWQGIDNNVWVDPKAQIIRLKS